MARLLIYLILNIFLDSYSNAKAAEIAEALGEIESYWVQVAVQDYLRQYDLDYIVKLA